MENLSTMKKAISKFLIFELHKSNLSNLMKQKTLH